MSAQLLIVAAHKSGIFYITGAGLSQTSVLDGGRGGWRSVVAAEGELCWKSPDTKRCQEKSRSEKKRSKGTLIRRRIAS